MKITLSEEGGWSAGVGPTSKTIDLGLLDPHHSQAGILLVEKLMNVCSESPAKSSRARDDMTFAITIEENGKTKLFSANSTALSPEFGELLGWIKQQVRRSMGKEK